MKIGITGGSGFIGSHLVDLLLEHGHEVFVLDLVQPHRSDVTFRFTDIINFDSCKYTTAGLDVVYHLAAVSNVNVAIRDKRKCIEVNTLGTLNILNSCKLNGVKRVIYASTEWVYHALAVKNKQVITSEDDVLDAAKMNHVYTISKYYGELMCRLVCDVELEFTILRFGIPYGPRSRSGTVIHNFLSNVLHDKPLQIYGEGKQFRNFIYVRDLVAGCVAALSPKAANEVFNLSGTKSVTILEMAHTIKELFGNHVTIQFVEQRDQDFGGVVARIDKAEKMLGWYPKVDLKEGLKLQYQWLKETQVKESII